MDEIRGSPLTVGSLEELMDDEQHAIVSTSVGSEHYVPILSFVDKVSSFPFLPFFLSLSLYTRHSHPPLLLNH